MFDINKYKLTPEEVQKVSEIPGKVPEVVPEKPTLGEKFIETTKTGVKELFAPSKTPTPWMAYLPGEIVKRTITAPFQVGGEMLKGAGKFGLSTAAVLPTTIKGKAPEWELPGIGKTFQKEAEERASKIIEGEKPLYHALAPFIEVPLAAMDAQLVASGLWSGAKAATTPFKTQLDDVIKLTQPVLKKAGAIKAFERAGRPGGVKVAGTWAKEATPREIEVAKDAAPFVSKNYSPPRNLANLSQEITRISEEEVKPGLEASKAIFNKNILKNRLEKMTPPDYIIADKTLNKTFQLIKQRMLGVVDRAEKTMPGLWEARKEFDDIIQEQYGNRVFDPDKNSAIKDGYLQSRQVVNDFIGEVVPEFKPLMKKLTNLYSARHNIAEQNWKLLNSNVVSRVWKQHPILRKVLELGGFGGVVAGAYQILKKD